MLRRFWPPPIFGAAHDLFELSREVRDFFPFSCHRFVIVGGERTGAVVHQDPKASGAWNTCLFGVKRWVFFPPSVRHDELQLEPGDASIFHVNGLHRGRYDVGYMRRTIAITVGDNERPRWDETTAVFCLPSVSLCTCPEPVLAFMSM